MLQTQREVQERAEKGRQLWDHSAWPPPSLSAALSPDGAEGAGGGNGSGITRPSAKIRLAPGQIAAEDIWGHFPSL